MPLYVNPNAPGNLTQTYPSAPNYPITVGIVTVKSKTVGVIAVTPGIALRLEDLADVDGTPLNTSGQFLVWNQTARYFDSNYNINNYLLNTDQRYNDTALINITNYTLTQRINSLNINASFNQSLTDSLYLPLGDQRYNDTVAINAMNITNKNITVQNINPQTNILYSLGTAILRWLNLFVVNLDVSGNATVNGTLTTGNIKTNGMINTTDGMYIGGNLILQGNTSMKRPYWNGYDNSTQGNPSASNANIMNISNNNDYDSYGIHVINRQNLTFDMTGDYLCIVSPEFTSTGTSADLGFWMQKNGVDVPWSNSRYTVANGAYIAPAIPFQFDITNPATDNIRFMWYSSNTNAQIVSVSGLTSPTRPSVPGVILNCQKVSEITE